MVVKESPSEVVTFELRSKNGEAESLRGRSKNIFGRGNKSKGSEEEESGKLSLFSCMGKCLISSHTCIHS